MTSSTECYSNGMHITILFNEPHLAKLFQQALTHAGIEHEGNHTDPSYGVGVTRVPDPGQIVRVAFFAGLVCSAIGDLDGSFSINLVSGR